MNRIFVYALLLLLALPAAASDMEADQAARAALEAKLAAQEARLADLEAKAFARSDGGAPANLVSLRKNATVTIGGIVTTGHYFGVGKVEKRNAAGGMATTNRWKMGSMSIDDAKVFAAVEVNEHLDAGIQINLHGTSANADNTHGIVREYWIRWKNIRDSGFGVLVGRTLGVFGDPRTSVSYLDSMALGGWGDGLGWFGGAVGYEILPYNGWKFFGVNQITPYWEGLGGKLKIEVSLMQTLWNDSGALRDGLRDGATHVGTRDGVFRVRSRNYGLGTMSGRVAYSPIEDLTFSASAINFHSNGPNGDWQYDGSRHAKNNTATSLSFTWRPAFLKKAFLWSQWLYGRNVDNIEGAYSNVFNWGLSWDFTDRFTVFVQGDYLKGRYDWGGGDRSRQRGWAAYIGGTYALSDGVTLEAGWRHDVVKRLDNGRLAQRITSDLVFGNVCFAF